MPACAIIDGSETPIFGIENDEAGMITQSLKVTHKRDKKELRNSCGSVVSVAYYNRMSEIEIEGVLRAAFTYDVGDAFTFANSINPAVVGKIIIDEISTDMSNEDFVKTSMKCSAYELIL